MEYKIEDFIVKAKLKEGPFLEEQKEHFNVAVSKHYYHDLKADYMIYALAQQRKLEYNAPILNGESIIELTNTINETEYYSMMYDVIMSCFQHDGTNFSNEYFVKINGLVFQDYKMFRDYVDTIFTQEVLNSNTLPENFIVDFTDLVQNHKDAYFLRNHSDRESIISNPIKKYQKGMKLTRFFTALTELFSKKNKETERAIGRFRIDPNDKVKIFMSAYLPSIVRSGAIGNSCLSNGGQNEHATFMILGYQNVLVIHDNAFEFRAFLALDHKNKLFTLAHTYPRENFFLQLVAYNFLQRQGYQPVRDYFSFPDYMDMGIANQFKAKHMKDFNQSDRNRDAFFEYTKNIFVNLTDPSDEKIAYVYGCEGCDKASVSPHFTNESGYCDSCAENDEDYGCCERCDDRLHNDYLYYDEDDDTYYCQGCRDEVEEERQEEKQREEEEQLKRQEEEEKALEAQNVTDENLPENLSKMQSVELYNEDNIHPVLAGVNLDIGLNLIKRHEAKNFYDIIYLMKRIPSFITEKDIEYISRYYSKISNFREYVIYGSLMDMGNVRWRDGVMASKWNPKTIGTNYPYYIGTENIKDEINQTTHMCLHYGTELASNTRDKNEKYLRYFYLAKNKLFLIKEHLENYVNPLLFVGDAIPVQDQLAYVQKSYSYADIDAILPFEKEQRFKFENIVALQLFMYMAHEVGFISNDKTPLYTKVAAINSGNVNQFYFTINNKGAISLHDSANMPDDCKTITKEMMIKLSN